MSHRQYSNREVSQYLQNIATAYTIRKRGRFRIAAYQNASETVANYPENVFQLWRQNPQILDSIPNIGPSILKKIDYLFNHHQPHPSVKLLLQNIHPAIFVFTPINSIGPLIADKLTRHFHFSRRPATALDQLVKYAQAGKIRQIPGFGQKSEEAILSNALSFLGRKRRMSYPVATKLANQIIKYLRLQFPKVEFVALGSLRRRAKTIGDIDIAAASITPKPIINYFLDYPESTQIIASGQNKASIRLLHDVHVDIMVKPPSSFGSLIQHFTGNKLHNILLRKHALKLGFSLSEYGLKNLKTGKIKHFSNETELYNSLNLRFIPPRFRLGKLELEEYKLL